MFVHMVPERKEIHEVRGARYELYVYRVKETGEYTIYVAKSGFGVGDIFVASQEAVADARSTAMPDLVGTLMEIAKDDINRNEYGQY